MPQFPAGWVAVMQGEEASVLSLVPSAVAVSPVQSGNWSDPMTWGGMMMQPGPTANVIVPPGVELVQDGDFRVNSFRSDGTFKASRTKSSNLYLPDAFVVNYGGTFDYGTPADPIPDGINATITFTDPAPIDRAHDPKALGRGLVALGKMLSNGQMGAMGTVSICGATKTPWLQFPKGYGVIKGNTNLPMLPPDWNVGDILLFPGTYSDSKDETVTITSISMGMATFAPLLYQHKPQRADRSIKILNLTRNVNFTSLASDPQRRGHVMFMHTDQVSVDNAAFNNMGRTDKSKPINDSIVIGGVLQPDTGTNPRARYPIHSHRVYNFLDECRTPVTGCVVNGSAGWGFVNHSSHMKFDQCIAYDCYGAGFVTEAGDEKTVISNNVAVHCMGNRTLGVPVDPFEGADGVGGNQNFGVHGHGIWLQNKYNNHVTGNDIYECGGAGIYANWRGMKQAVVSPNHQDQWTIAIGDSILIANPSEPMQNSDAFPFSECDGNTFTGCNDGIFIQGQSGLLPSVLSNSTGSYIWRYGIDSYYSGNIDIVNPSFLMVPNGVAIHAEGIHQTGGYSNTIRTKGVINIEGAWRGLGVPGKGPNTVDFAPGSFLDNLINVYMIATDTNYSLKITGDPKFGTKSSAGGADWFLDKLTTGNAGGAVMGMDSAYFRPNWISLDTIANPKSQIFVPEQLDSFNFFSLWTPFQLAAWTAMDQALANGPFKAKYGFGWYGFSTPDASTVPLAKSNGLMVGPIQPQVPNWLLKSAKITNSTALYQLKYFDGVNTITDPTFRALNQDKWNVLPITHNGVSSSLMVLSDTIPPTWALDAGGEPAVATADLGKPYVLNGKYHDNSLYATGVQKDQSFVNLLAFPVKTNPMDGSKFLTASFVIADPAGNKATISQDVVVI